MRFSDRTKRFLWLTFWGALIFGGAAFLLNDFPEAISVAVMGGFISLFIGKILEICTLMRFRRLTITALFILLSIGGGTAAYFGWIVFRSSSLSAYPIAHGDFATFDGAAGTPARTSMGTHFSIFSDSVWNLGSRIYYKKLDFEARRNDGFLRVFFQLNSDTSSQPYAGIYADLSPPPARGFDISRFRFFEARLRVGQDVEISPISLEFVLYPVRMDGPDYTFPTYELKKHELREEWISVKVGISDFTSPSFHRGRFEYDPNSIYRVGINIKGQPNSNYHGHVDIDYIKFAR